MVTKDRGVQRVNEGPLPEQRMNADQFWEFATQPRNRDRRLELIDGVVNPMSPSSAIPAMLAIELILFIGNYVKTHNLGYLSGPDGGFRLDEGNVYAPDLAFITKGRLTETPERYFPIAPDFVVEILSPTDRTSIMRRKVVRYLELGVRLVWVFYPEDRGVDICRRNAEGRLTIQVLTEADTLDGEDVLPGFKLSISALFASLNLPPAKTKSTRRKRIADDVSSEAPQGNADQEEQAE